MKQLIERMPLKKLIELCKSGHKDAIAELKRRWGIDWDKLREGVSK